MFLAANFGKWSESWTPSWLDRISGTMRWRIHGNAGTEMDASLYFTWSPYLVLGAVSIAFYLSHLNLKKIPSTTRFQTQYFRHLVEIVGNLALHYCQLCQFLLCACCVTTAASSNRCNDQRQNIVQDAWYITKMAGRFGAFEPGANGILSGRGANQPIKGTPKNNNVAFIHHHIEISQLLF